MLQVTEFSTNFAGLLNFIDRDYSGKIFNVFSLNNVVVSGNMTNRR